MKVAISHTKVKPDKRAEIDAAGKRVLEALERERPQGILYAICLFRTASPRDVCGTPEAHRYKHGRHPGGASQHAQPH
ncbi:hypothetical protein KSD_54500 [Ktedonobacter sp. SOSP1-85]|nr:hypothetical protein KSD_54500 [Ktedonobacter sp. SOSP1-85]